jgi:hypothetical protein
VKEPTFDELMAEKPEEFFSNSGNRYDSDEIESMLDYKLRNSSGKSKEFFRSIQSQWEEKRFLTEKQVGCLE